MPLVAEDYTWDFLFDTLSAWPLAHIINPFILQIVFQRVWLSFLIIWAWESLEVLAVVVFRGDYLIFVGDQSDLEPVTDTLLGDIIQGALGILLALLVQFTWKIPRWTPSILGRYKSLAWHKILQYIFWVVAFSLFNTQLQLNGTYPINYGLHICYITTIFFIWTWYHTDYSELSRSVVWNGYDREMYTNVYAGIMINVSVLFFSVSFHFWYSYFQTWMAYVFLLVFNISIIVASGRVTEFVYVLTLRQQQGNPYFSPYDKRDW